MTDLSSYKEKYNKVKIIINDLDPVGLVSGGAPEDEYDNQINKIVALLQKEAKSTDLGEQIYQIFLESFGPESVGEKNNYIEIAKKIQNVL